MIEIKASNHSELKLLISILGHDSPSSWDLLPTHSLNKPTHKSSQFHTLEVTTQPANSPTHPFLYLALVV